MAVSIPIGGTFLVLLLLGAVAVFVLAFAGLFFENLPAKKLMSTASALMGMASVIQLRFSGWFDRVMTTYTDDSKFPLGPPSEITRQIIDHPDFPLQSWLRDALFYDPHTGATIAIVGLSAAIIGAWL
jgi:hypothetical protein